MAIHKTTEQQQLWQHRSGRVVMLDAIAPADETDESAEYRYSSQGLDMGTESEFLAVGWVKIDSSEYLGKPFDKIKGAREDKAKAFYSNY